MQTKMVCKMEILEDVLRGLGLIASAWGIYDKVKSRREASRKENEAKTADQAKSEK